MIPWHVVSGLNGAVMVLPRDRLNDGHGPLNTTRRAYARMCRVSHRHSSGTVLAKIHPLDPSGASFRTSESLNDALPDRR
jgi:hypothetical protein